jgi:predicted amidophosphoribosyltransferase
MEDAMTQENHPWRAYTSENVHACRKCGKAISQTIQLCDSCKKRFNTWFSDDGHLRYIECTSLEMGISGTTPLQAKIIYA